MLDQVFKLLFEEYVLILHLVKNLVLSNKIISKSSYEKRHYLNMCCKGTSYVNGVDGEGLLYLKIGVTLSNRICRREHFKQQLAKYIDYYIKRIRHA